MKKSSAVVGSAGIAALSLTVVLLATPAAADDTKVCSGPTCSGACAAVAVDQVEQERLGELVSRQRDELVSLARTLAVEQKRGSQLQSELASARSAAVPQVAVQAPAAAPA